MYLHSRMIESGAKVGKANGLRLLLDAETFDYTFHLSASEGFKLAVQHHLGNSLIQLHLKALLTPCLKCAMFKKRVLSTWELLNA